MPKHVFKVMVMLLVVISAFFFTSAPALAADLRGGETVNVASGQVVDDDLYIAGNTVIIDGTVNGDIWAVGGTITINGAVNGSIVAVGQTININGDVARAVRLVGGTINVRGNIDGDLMVFGGAVNIDSAVRINGDLLLGAGSVAIKGLIEGDIKGGAGKVTITNEVWGDIELEVGSLIIASTANIKGDLIYTSENEADIQSGAQISGEITYEPAEAGREDKEARAMPFSGIGGKVLGFLMAFVTGLIIILVATRRTTSIADSIKGKPWPSLGWGAVILFTTPIAAIIICITVIGIPVGLIALALYGIAIYLSQVPVALFIGRWIIGYFREVDSKAILVGAMAAGLVIISLLRMIPFAGFVIGLVVILFGLGAAVVSEKRLRDEA